MPILADQWLTRRFEGGLDDGVVLRPNFEGDDVSYERLYSRRREREQTIIAHADDVLIR